MIRVVYSIPSTAAISAWLKAEHLHSHPLLAVAKTGTCHGNFPSSLDLHQHLTWKPGLRTDRNGKLRCKNTNKREQSHQPHECLWSDIVASAAARETPDARKSLLVLKQRLERARMRWFKSRALRHSKLRRASYRRPIALAEYGS